MNKSSDKCVVNSFLKIDNCSILTHGIKPSSIPIEYGYCITCDVNLIQPICKECLHKCHEEFEHVIKIQTNLGNIVCSCGMRLHEFPIKIKASHNLPLISNFNSCPYMKWNNLINKTQRYVVNRKVVCFFCHELCGFKNIGYEIDKENIDRNNEVCECNWLNTNCNNNNSNVHSDLKSFYNKIQEHINDNSSFIYEYFGVIKFMNLMFVDKETYNYLYSNFQEMINELLSFNNSNNVFTLKDNFLETNFFYALKSIMTLSSKLGSSPIRYFTNKLVETFSFDFISTILNNVLFEQSFQYWSFIYHILFIYKQITLESLIKNTIPQFKLHDLENLTTFQRKIIFLSNNTLYSQFQKQIPFFIKCLSKYNVNSLDINHKTERCKVICIVCSILKKISSCFIFTPLQMISFCNEFLKEFNYNVNVSYSLQLKLYDIVIKMLHYFILIYNDNVFYSCAYEYCIQHNNKKINIDKNNKYFSSFIFSKNELGRLITRIVIRIMFYCEKQVKYKSLCDNVSLNKYDQKYIKQIIKHSFLIINYLIGNDDVYITNDSQITKNNKLYLNVIMNYTLNLQTNKHMSDNGNYNKVLEITNNINKYYHDYYVFKLNENDMIIKVKESLCDIIVLITNEMNNEYENLLALNMYYSFSKIFYIISNNDNIINNNNQFHLLIQCYFEYMYIFVNKCNDNALIMFSTFIMNALLQIPVIYSDKVFSFYKHCSELIIKHNTVITSSHKIIKSLYNYLLLLKTREKEIINQIQQFRNSNDSFDETFKLENVLFSYLNIMNNLVVKIRQKTISQIEQIYRKSLSILNDILQQFIQNNNNLNNTNICLILHIINNILDNSEVNNKEIFIKDNINDDLLFTLLDDISISLELRYEILCYLHKMKGSLYYDCSLNQNNEYLSIFSNIYDYFPNCVNNPLISNYKFPTMYLTFINQMISINNKDSITNIKNDISYTTILSKEMHKIKSIYLKNISNFNLFMIYFIKGLLIPLALVTKKLFSFSQICDGNTILILYNALMELLYVKNYFYSLGNLFYESLLKIKIKGFKLKEFLSKDNQRDTLEEYFMTKSQQNYSAFDFSKLYLAFEKHLYKFILHPHSFNLNENFSINELELYKRIDNYILYNKSNNTKKISINISNSLTFNTSENINNIDEYTNEDKQDIANTNIHYTTNEKINNNSNNTINANHKQKTQLIVPKTKVGNFDYTNTLTLNNDDNYTDNIIISIYSIYKNKKSTLTNTTSSFFMALPETCYQHESNFRKIFLQVLFLFIINNKSSVYLTQSYQLLYILLSLDTSETQNDIKNILLLSLPSSLPTDKFITSLSHHLYISLMKVFMNELSIENPIMLFIHSYRVFNLLKICKYLCEEHNNYFQNKIINQLTYKYSNWVDLTLQNQHNKSYLISKKEESESDSEEKLIEMNIINNQNKISNNYFDNVNTLENISFFNFLINVLTKIIIITSQVKKSRHVEMYYDIISCIIDFLVEGIQGNKNDIICKRNFLSQNEIIQNQQSIQTFHIFSQKVSDILFNDSLNTGHPFKVRMLLMSFFISLFEDEKNEDLQKIVIKFLNIKRVLNSIISTLKMYFFKKQTSIGNTTFQNINEVIFDYNVYCFYKKEYTYNNLLHESDEFNLAHVYYNYIKLLSVFNRLPEAVNLLKKTSQVNEDVAKKKYKIENKSNGHKSIANKLFKIKESKISPCNLISNKEKVIKIEEIEIYFTLKLFENITKVVELRLPSNQTQLVLYTLPSEMIYLSKMTKKEFFANVDRTSENSKKNALIKHIALFQKEINYYKKRQSNCLGRILSKVNYIYVQIFVYIYVVTFNIVIISTLQGYKELEETETINTRLRLRSLFSIPSKINESIDTSLNEWAVIYDILAYIFVCMNAFFIIVWIIFRLPLYYKLDKIVYLEENKIKSKHDISMCQKIYIAIVKSIFERDHINSLLFMFILSLVGVILKRGEIIYGFCLLAIVDLNQTLKGIILAVQRRYSSLGATGLLMIALVYFYTNIGFFFFNEDYEAIIETEETDNYCESLVFCFLTNIDAGIRARGGAADQMKRISFERNMGHYVTRLFFDVTYFLICIIIMIDLVFGIILGTFSELRAEEIKYQDDKENHCFICHVSREEIEKKGKVDFDFHRENLHNLWTYVEYMIFLKFSKLHDLNAPNAYAKEMLDRKNICFLPSEGNGEKEKEEDFDNELNLENKLEEEEEETDEEEEEDDNEQNNVEEI